MADGDGDAPIGGPDTHVEIGETLIGGVKRGTHNRGSAAKTVLIGAMGAVSLTRTRLHTMEPRLCGQQLSS